MTLTAAAPTTFVVGMRVRSNSHKFPGLGTVKKVNKVTVAVTMDDGRTVKFDRSFLTEATSDADVAPAAVPYIPIDFNAFPAGTPVRFTDARAAARFGSGMFVVIKNGGDRINVAKFGGDNDRYVRAAASGLERIPANEIAAYINV